MGYLSLADSSSGTFRQSKAALTDTTMAIEELIYREHQINIGYITKVIRGLNVTLRVEGNTLTAVKVSDVVELSDGTQWILTVYEQASSLMLTSIPMQKEPF